MSSSCALPAAIVVPRPSTALTDNGGLTKTFLPPAGSPLIDAIPVSTARCDGSHPTDRRGVSRPQGTACDIGSVEVAPWTEHNGRRARPRRSGKRMKGNTARSATPTRLAGNRAARGDQPQGPRSSTHKPTRQGQTLFASARCAIDQLPTLWQASRTAALHPPSRERMGRYARRSIDGGCSSS